MEDETTPAALKEPVVKESVMEERDLKDRLQGRLSKELAKSINIKTQAILPHIKNEPVTARKIKNEPITPARPGTSKIPNSQTRKRIFPTITPKRIKNETITPGRPGTSRTRKVKKKTHGGGTTQRLWLLATLGKERCRPVSSG